MAVAQTCEQVFPYVRHLLQFVEGEKAAGALDGMDGTENSRQSSLVVRMFFQADQIAVETVQVFVTLRQELLDNVAIAHLQRSFPAISSTSRSRGVICSAFTFYRRYRVFH